MSALTPGQQGFVENLRAALAVSHRMNIRTATEGDLCRNVGRLEAALEQALRIIDELTEAQ